MADYLISDLHLEASTPGRCDAFFRFVEQDASDAKRLFILGDFFDAWIGDDEDALFCRAILDKLKQWVNDGLSIAFTHGNRDFLVGSHFAEYTGVELLQEEHIALFGDEPVLLLHGDSLCTDDTEYMQFRQQVRNPQWQQQILQLPLAQRRVMAQQLRAQSQSMNAMKASDIMDVNHAQVISAFSRHKVAVMIHGHTHRPAVHEVNAEGVLAKRYVLGDWQDKGWYIRWDGKSFELQDFPI